MVQPSTFTEHTHQEQFQKRDNGLVVRAPAKINLVLLIGQKRPDNFHQVWSIMAKINWYDEIFIEPAPKTSLVCNGSYWAPQGNDNLVLRAAELLEQKTSRKLAAKFTLTKNIPAGTGLGSASSDAAATLIGLNKAFDLKLSVEELSGMAGQLGSDVAFFLDNWMSVCTGKGEKISPVAEKKQFVAMLAVPDVSVSTKEVYENFKPDVEKYHNLHDKLCELIEQNKLDFQDKLCTNMLEQSCFDLHSQLAGLKAELESLTGDRWRLSGSGSAMYAIITYLSADFYRKISADRCSLHLIRSNLW
ncbi:MAG: 4-(cytidine 5'-diphospho)-2-C-methyl-D-erythritol kinase [Phycisphaerae bacterium]|nr:4-(cytidine 5'-diphospho)-2-C-methyl-D-erythritol kinase [Phycisphaerae bacterium]